MNITSHDNRGTADAPYGFVYFDDGSRVVYATGVGVTPFVGPHWKSATAVHGWLAVRYLKSEFPSGNWFQKDHPER